MVNRNVVKIAALAAGANVFAAGLEGPPKTRTYERTGELQNRPLEDYFDRRENPMIGRLGLTNALGFDFSSESRSADITIGPLATGMVLTMANGNKGVSAKIVWDLPFENEDGNKFYLKTFEVGGTWMHNKGAGAYFPQVGGNYKYGEITDEFGEKSRYSNIYLTFAYSSSAWIDNCPGWDITATAKIKAGGLTETGNVGTLNETASYSVSLTNLGSSRFGYSVGLTKSNVSFESNVPDWEFNVGVAYMFNN
ncbi:hypothetical protein KO465_01315 [Candidatus Micrarchaeota archaeon]|nr:hypothetical protein [Candidatus Micrarchaeota archaeon]